VENLTEFFQRFRELNVRSSEQLDQLVNRAQRVIRGVDPQDLRDNAGLRQHVATEMSQVQSVLDGLLVLAVTSSAARSTAVRATFRRLTVASSPVCPRVPAANSATNNHRVEATPMIKAHDLALLNTSPNVPAGYLAEYLGNLSARAKTGDSVSSDRRTAAVDQLLMRME